MGENQEIFLGKKYVKALKQDSTCYYNYLNLYFTHFITSTGNAVTNTMFPYTYIFAYTKIPEVNLFAFAYRLFHGDFSPINGTFAYRQLGGKRV